MPACSRIFSPDICYYLLLSHGIDVAWPLKQAAVYVINNVVPAVLMIRFIDYLDYVKSASLTSSLFILIYLSNMVFFATMNS